MSQGKADKLRSLPAAARPAQTRRPDEASQRDLAMDRAADQHARQRWLW